MTDAFRTDDDWDPGRRRDATRPRTDRRRLGWRDFRHNYRGFVLTLTLAVAAFVALDAWLLTRYQRYQRETRLIPITDHVVPTKGCTAAARRPTTLPPRAPVPRTP